MPNQNDAQPETEPDQNLQVKKYRTLLINMKFDKWDEKRDTRNDTKHIALRYIALLIYVALRYVDFIVCSFIWFDLVWFCVCCAILRCVNCVCEFGYGVIYRSMVCFGSVLVTFHQSTNELYCMKWYCI